jgi:hypothetical protein
VREPSCITAVRVRFLSVPLGGPEVDGRSGLQWLKSAIGYCEWRAGLDWRRSSQRNDPERWYYLDAVRLLNDLIQVAPKDAPQFALPSFDPAPTPAQLRYREMKRSALVTALMRENPRLTNRRILSHFSTEKLARMLDDLRRGAVEVA